MYCLVGFYKERLLSKWNSNSDRVCVIWKIKLWTDINQMKFHLGSRKEMSFLSLFPLCVTPTNGSL